MSVTSNSYASKVNSKYRNDGSNFVDLKDRLNQTIQGYSSHTKRVSFNSAIKLACQVFERLHPNKKKIEDLNLVESNLIPLSDILIDTTMQRMLILSWVIEIIKNWRDVQCQPIQVYRVVGNDHSIKYYPSGKNLYASWDGQHTAMALYILCVYVFKQDPSKVMIPVNIYKVETKADIRANFIKGNSSEGKKLLDTIDIFQQQVYGVRHDGAKNTEWEEAELKQQYLEAADLFVTAEKFGDIDQPGAISRMQEINGYTSDIIKQFCLYAVTVMPEGGRPIASQEIEIVCAWLDMARKGGIEYTDEEVVSLAMHINALFNADFHESSVFWEKVRKAYENWWKKYWAGVDEEYRPKHMSFSKNWRNGGAFLWHQFKHSWVGRIPELNINTPFTPATKDLYHV